MARHASITALRLPDAPPTITAGSSLKVLLDHPAIECLAHNLRTVHRNFDAEAFAQRAKKGLKTLAILQRGHHIAQVLREHLPQRYDQAIDILLRSLTPPLTKTKDVGLGVFFYLPHISFIARYGLDEEHNGGRDPFEASMKAQYELTRRFSAEYSIRPFLIRWPDRTLARLTDWLTDPCPHVRRLCTEGTRPRLPWAIRIPSFIADPRPVLPILEALKDDESLYVRRSVANHLGDIYKDHAELMLEICARWLNGASTQRKWLLRHSLRYPAKKGVKEAVRLRRLAT